MKILVTGSAGYIGSHLLLLIEQLRPEWEVFGLDKIPGQTFCCDLASDPIPEERFDVVVHLAGHAFVERPDCSADEVEYLYRNNLTATRRLAKSVATKKFVFASSCAVYGHSIEPLQESMPLNPMSNYGVTKMRCENRLLEWQEDSIERHVHIMRLFNVAGWFGGKHEAARRIVPSSVLAALFGDDMTISVDEYGNILHRDFVHIVDVCAAIIKAVEHHCCGLYNIGSGTGEEISFPYATALLIQGQKGPWQVKTKLKNANEPLCCVADIRKAKKVLGWSPTKDLRAIVSSSIESIKEQACQTSPVK